MKKRTDGKMDMGQEMALARQRMAFAALVAVGRPEAMLPALPEGQRKYLFCAPSEGDGDSPFDPDELSCLLRESGLPVAVEYDRGNRHFGLRYVSSATSVPAQIARFASRQARTCWEAWKNEQSIVSREIRTIARRAASGAPLLGQGPRLENAGERG